MAGWTFTAVNLHGDECRHDHYRPDAAGRCASKMAAEMDWQEPVFILARSPEDRKAGRPHIVGEAAEKPPDKPRVPPFRNLGRELADSNWPGINRPVD